MSALLYFSYSAKLNEVEKATIDKEVIANRLALKRFFKSVYGKSKIMITSNTLCIMICFSGMKNINTGDHRSIIPVSRTNHSMKFVPKYSRFIVEKPDKVLWYKTIIFIRPTLSFLKIE